MAKVKTTTNKEFTVVGVSCMGGTYKVRYANSTKRGAVLVKNGHTDVVLVEMPFPGRKEDAVDALLGLVDSGEFNELQKAAVIAEARAFGFVV
jgi:ribose 5-phosphate isomerase